MVTPIIAPQQQLSKPPTVPLPNKAANVVKHGIVSILGTNKSSSIRRTSSADMSSKQWLSQNGFFYPIKKISPSEDLTRLEEDNELNRPKICDVWSSILSQKKENDGNSNLEIPYVHPLVKRSSSSLSEKSLEICTESLGSETGSDPRVSSSEGRDVDEEEKDDQQKFYNSQSTLESRVVKYTNCNKRASSFPKPFPPPVPSLAKRGNNKPSLQIKSHRHDGRLTLEAISVPPRNLFHAQRSNGRLLLTFIDSTTSSISEPEMQDHDHEAFEEEQQEQGQIDNEIKGMEQKLRMSNGVMNLGTWSVKFNKVVNLTGSTELSKSLPFPPAYEYFWRKKPTVASQLNNNYTAMPRAQQTELQDLVLMGGNKAANMNCLVAFQNRGGKETRRSLLIWIAAS